MNKVQNQLEEMGVFENKKLAQKMLEVEERMHEKAEIRKGYWWVSVVSFVMGTLFFIGDGASLIAFMLMLGVMIWLQERTDKKLKKLNDVSITQYTVAAEETKPNEKDMFASMSAQNDLLKRHPERYSEPQCTGKDA